MSSSENSDSVSLSSNPNLTDENHDISSADSVPIDEAISTSYVSRSGDIGLIVIPVAVAHTFQKAFLWVDEVVDTAATNWPVT